MASELYKHLGNQADPDVRRKTKPTKNKAERRRSVRWGVWSAAAIAALVCVLVIVVGIKSAVYGGEGSAEFGGDGSGESFVREVSHDIFSASGMRG